MKPMLCAQALSRGLRRVPRTCKLAFFAAFISGLAVYLFALTNIVICTSDALTNAVFGGDLTFLGRWSSQWLSGLGTDYSMPLVNGLLALLAVSVTAAVAVAYLDIRQGLNAALAGAALMLYPTVGNTLKYLHNADGYMIAAMLAIVSLYALDRLRFGFFISVPLLAVSIGTYQANASLVISLMLVRAVGLITAGKRGDRELARLALKYALCVAASLLLYYALAYAVSRATGVALVDYQSVSDMGRLSLPQLAKNFVLCYGDFKNELTFLSFRPGYYVSGYPNYLYFLVTWGLAFTSYFMGGNGTRVKGAALFALFLLSPMLMCGIRMGGPDGVHSLMTYSVSALYLLGISMMDGLPEIAPRPALFKRPRAFGLVRTGLCAASWALVICLVVCCFAWSVGINLDYYNGKLEYDNLRTQCGAFLTMAERQPGYRKGMPIYVVGSLGGSGSSRGDPALNSPKHYYAFMVRYLDVRMPYGIANEIDDAAYAVAATEEFAAMPAYPERGCCRVIDGAMTLKLSRPAQ